ncbi:acyltransferase [Sphingomonas sp. PB2P12]|uniref:acyltransferase family protein n=1 Tax=Sphingomonas sandaracina TaxID=3096157 RepID=UPI002FCBC9D2
MRTELRALTGARGLAAWFVVLYHIRLSIAGLPQAALDILAKGYLAVDFFFLLSGFVIWLTWHERLRAQGIAGIGPFLRKRIARIWPLHIVVLAGAVALALVFVATGRADPVDYPFGQLPLNILLVQNWGFTNRLAWNNPSWSISAELGAYLLFPLLMAMVDWRRMASPVLMVVAAAILVLLHMTMAAPTLGTDIPRYGLLRCLTEFATGTIVSALWLRWHAAQPMRAAIAASTAGIALLGAWAAGAPETLMVPAACACLLLVLALTSAAKRNPLSSRPIHYLGEISYATYLGHFMLWVVFKLLFVSNADAVPPTLIALYLGLVLIASVTLYHLIERPAQRKLNRLPSRSREGSGEGDRNMSAPTPLP